MRKVLLTIGLGIIFTLLGLNFPKLVHAAVVSKNIDRVYSLQTGYVDVTETMTMQVVDNRYLVPGGRQETFVVFNPIISDSEATEKINKTLPTISVTNGYGTNLDFTTQIDEQNINISVDSAFDLYAGTVETIQVKYRSYALLQQTGALYDFYTPSFAKDYQFSDGTTSLNVNTKVLIPISMGQINLVTPQKTPTTEGDNQVFNFSQQDLTGNVSWIQIGTTQYYKFDLEQPYKSSTTLPLVTNEYKIVLPRNIKTGALTQQVFYGQISPNPSEINIDDNGNLIATFLIPANQNGSIKVSGYAKLTQDHSFQLDNAELLKDINSQILSANTNAANYWEVKAPEIQTTATQLKGSLNDALAITNATYKFVVDKIDYSLVKRFGLNMRQGALKTLEGGAAVCMEYSDLFITLMRAQGVPARAAFGYGYDSRGTDGENLAHQWAEIYLPTENTWLSVDPTWGESGSAVIGADLNHFYRYIASNAPDDPAPIQVAFFGSLPALDNEDFQIKTVSALPIDVTFQTEDEIVAKFKPTNSISKVFYQLIGIPTQLNSKLDSFLTNYFAASNVPFVKIAIYFTPVLAISGIFVWRKYHSRLYSKVAPA